MLIVSKFYTGYLLLLALLFVPADGRAQSVTTYQTTWLGNSFSSVDDKWVQNNITSISVLVDGTVYTNSLWDEATREISMYKNGAATGRAVNTHGFGRLGGYSIASDGEYVYADMRQSGCDGGNQDLNLNGKRQYPDCGPVWHAVRRLKLDATPAPLPGGYGVDGSMLLIALTSEKLDASRVIAGLAVKDGELFVSIQLTDTIAVYNAAEASAAPLRTWAVHRPRAITFDKSGNLWVIQEGIPGQTAAKILSYTTTGQLLPQYIALSPEADPIALAVSSSGQLLIADNGRDQNIKIYKIDGATPQMLSTLGEKGGILAGVRGLIGPLRFNGLTGVGTDAAGNIYVSENGRGPENADLWHNTSLRAFSSAGTMLWRLYGNEFLDSAVFDPTQDGTSLYTKDTRYEVDYSRTSGLIAQDKAFTLDRFTYQNDPRLKARAGEHAVALRYIRGHKFLFVATQYSVGLLIYRFEGEIAVPSGWFGPVQTEELKFQNGDWPPNQPPAAGSWIWRDVNGNGNFDSNEYRTGAPDPYVFGWAVDSNGDIWQALRGRAGLRQYKLQGIDSAGNPIYSLVSSTVYPAPSIFADLLRVEYIPATDTLYLFGHTDDWTGRNCTFGIVGNIAARYDRWRTDRPVLKWTINLPYDCSTLGFAKAVAVAGKRFFTADMQNAVVRVYSTRDGGYLGQMQPGPTVASRSGLVDIPYAIQAFRRRNGEYVITVEEDGYGKIILYRLPR